MPDSTTQAYLLAENRLLREALGRILGKKVDIRVVGAGALSAQTMEEIVEQLETPIQAVSRMG